ncbi:MAG: hypothetical protein LBU70_09405 [Chitinispirillales bacterium]|jgi:hypothetical protein|nr:hypothetical protein [Chitinispirillales bacterium]
MKTIIPIIIFLITTTTATLSFEGNDDNVKRDYFVQLYKSQPYVSDFAQTFRNSSDKRDYRKLRAYISQKEEILRVLRMAGDEYYYGLSYNNLFAIDYLQNLEDELLIRKPGDRILLRLNSVRPSFDFSGEYTVEFVENEILPRIRARFEETSRRDSLDGIAYMQIQRNIEVLSQDIFHAEQAIYATLSPEFRDQDFRIWISLTFSGLIAVLLLAFFLIIFKRSDVTLSKQLLSSSGLQFITVFILIIAIILFGILNILGGSELAAIISGISGYILGKGGGATDTERERKKPELSGKKEIEQGFESITPATVAEYWETPIEGDEDASGMEFVADSGEYK